MTTDRILVGLAVEGVPVAAIARAFGVPSGDVWPVLRTARDRGELAHLPGADWPPGTRGRAAVPTGAPARLDDIPAILPGLRQTFGLTAQEGRFLAALLIRREMSKDALLAVVAHSEGIHSKLVETVACRVRQRIAPITITTVNGFGYALPLASRDAILAMVAQSRAKEGLR